MNGEDEVLLEKQRRLRRRKVAQKDKSSEDRRRGGWSNQLRRASRTGNLANRPELWGALEDE